MYNAIFSNSWVIYTEGDAESAKKISAFEINSSWTFSIRSVKKIVSHAFHMTGKSRRILACPATYEIRYTTCQTISWHRPARELVVKSGTHRQEQKLLPRAAPARTSCWSSTGNVTSSPRRRRRLLLILRLAPKPLHFFNHSRSTDVCPTLLISEGWKGT